MTQTIVLNVRHPEFEPGLIQGFRFFWAYYVTGYRSGQHCQPCFTGKRADNFCTGTARSGEQVIFQLTDHYRYVYICGVGVGPKAELHHKNFHWALRYERDSVIEAQTYNGYALTATNAVALPIPALPPGWNGLSLETTRCKNFQFAVEYFGYPSKVPATRRGRPDSLDHAARTDAEAVTSSIDDERS